MVPQIIVAITAGLKDSVSPGALTAILLFTVFLFFIAKTGRRIIRTGTGFIIGVGVGAVCLASGLCDFIGSIFCLRHCLAKVLYLMIIRRGV